MDDLTLITLTAAVLRAGSRPLPEGLEQLSPQGAVEEAFILRSITRQELAKRLRTQPEEGIRA